MINNKKAKRIAIDARLYGPVGKGLGRYIQEMVDGILASDHKNEYLIFLSPQNFDSFVLPRKGVSKYLIKARWYSLAEQFIWPRLIRKYKPDLIHFPHFNVPYFCPAKFIVTIHDLILTKYPSRRASTKSAFTYWLKHFFYKTIIRRAVKKAQVILTVSNFTKKDIITQFNVAADKIIVTYEGVAARLKKKQNQDDKKIILGYNIDTPYILYVGNAYPHKNLNALVDVFVNLREKHPDLSLVLIGGEDYFYQQLKKQTVKKRQGVFFPGFVSDNDLVSFYRLAAVYVFPSKYEGFGLPPLEAMTFGLPVVSSNQGSLPEILGSAALYFNPEDKEDMFAKINRLLLDENLRNQQKALGYQQVKKYNWNKCIEKTLSLYKKFT